MRSPTTALYTEDLCTYLASQQEYPVFMKSKLVVELIEFMSKLFFAHSEWKPKGTAIDRKIEVDMEAGYHFRVPTILPLSRIPYRNFTY